MKHTMSLFNEPFEAIKSGAKTVEIRLNDEKRRLIQVGDNIEFFKLPDKQDRIEVLIEQLMVFKTFEEMYNTLSFKDFGCEGRSMQEMIDGTYEIYTPEQEDKWGTLGIRIRLIES
ncbi:ASCH domain-containing protein [Paenibacillus sp. FSL K6-2524]|uniref:ASCH domain-containing protein n=1 Tax=Paenibacillus sp. FSL K6-2524 TaxID=2954516 RepID=UPI0030FBD339